MRYSISHFVYSANEYSGSWHNCIANSNERNDMTVTELQILLDLNYGNELDVLEEHASLTDYGYLFVDSEDGHCYLFDENGKMDDIKKIKTWNRYAKIDIKKIVILPNSVKSIGDWAFYNCTSLKSIEIPNSVKSIGDRAFYSCTSLKNVEIPESVKSIGSGAFFNCRSLKSIEIPESVEIIGYWTFYGCTSLEEVIFKGKTMDQTKAMKYYPWGIEDESIIKCS